MEKFKIKELATQVVKIMEEKNYSYNTICSHRARFKKICKYAEMKGELYFSEKLGREYLEWAYGYTEDYYKVNYPEKLRNSIRSIRLLGDYQLHGIIISKISKRSGYEKPAGFKEVLEAYENECEQNQYSYRGLRTRLQRLYFFIDYLAQKRIMSVREINSETISDYVIMISHKHEKSIAAILTTLRVFLRFLYQNAFIDSDLSLCVPKQNRYHYPSIPPTWTMDEVKKILGAVDKDAPIGKRDYAILLLVTRLGMRVGDLKSLQLSHLNWKEQTISIYQEKTKTPITYPILHDIGWALFDYLKNARPVTTSPYLFIRMNAPYSAFGTNANLHNIITKYIRLAGIQIPPDKKHGMHSLRHTLASTLIEQGATFAEISEILGHIDPRATEMYIHIDLEGLKNCILDPEGVFSDE